MRRKRANYREQADRLFSKHIRTRDEFCQAAGIIFDCHGNLQCAHIISRRYSTTRCDPSNAIALCASHHIYWTHRPLEWQDWIEARYPGRWDLLRSVALSEVKVNWREELAKVKTL